MKKSITLFLILCSFMLRAQEAARSDSLNRALVDIYSQLLVSPQEKIYVQTDRPYYLSGEKIFFRAFLIQASKLAPATFSKYLYVELVSPVDTVVVRTQIRMDPDKMFYGALALPESLPEGEYRIRSYTRYMENMGEGYFYTRSVFVADPKSAKAQAETSFEYKHEGQVDVKIRFKDAKTGEVKQPAQFQLQLGNSPKITTSKPDKDGGISQTVDLKENNSMRTLLVDYKDGTNSFRKYFQVPYETTTRPMVSFYPEGGEIIAGTSNRVAFKAMLPGGGTAEINGAVYNSHQEAMATFNTLHDGMGAFTFKAVAGETYVARCNYNNSTTDIPLPKVSSQAVALQAQWVGDSLEVSIRQSDEKPQTPYYLLMYRQGVPIYLQAWDYSTQVHKWGNDKFHTGVTHLLLLTNDFKVLSERMVFNNRHDEPVLEVSTNATSYLPRQEVSMDIRLPQAASDTLPATFAISVTDDKDVKIDSTTNIEAEILLSSELQGHISYPAWYMEPGKQVGEAADLLMLTQGWRSYQVPEALQGKLQKPTIKPETSVTITGMLKKPTGKPYKNGKVQLTAVGCKYSEVATSDNQGRFAFSNLEFPDSTAFQFLSFTNEKTTNIDICPNIITYPAVTIPWRYNQTIADTKQTTPDFADYVIKANNKYIQENGTRQIDLPEITVTESHRKKEKRLDNQAILSEPDICISSKELYENTPSSFEILFYKIRGVKKITKEGVYFRIDTTFPNPAIILVNGIEKKYSDLDGFYDPTDIAQIDVYKGAGVTMGWKTIEPIIALTTWPPGTSWGQEEGQATNIKNILPLGYQQPVEFYSPKYDKPQNLTTNNADLRSTIYWKPNVITEKDHKTSVSFYTADSPNTYSVVIEGIAPGRKLIYCRKNGLIKVMDKKLVLLK